MLFLFRGTLEVSRKTRQDLETMGPLTAWVAGHAGQAVNGAVGLEARGNGKNILDSAK